MNKITVFSLIGLAIVGLGRSIHAEDGGACSTDVRKYCSDVQPGGGAVAGCLKTHSGDLSSGCTAEIQDVKAKVRQRIDDFKAACKLDARKFCPDVKPGRGRIIACLEQHTSDLSSTCRQVLASRPPRMGGAMPKDASPSDASQPTLDDSVIK